MTIAPSTLKAVLEILSVNFDGTRGPSIRDLYGDTGFDRAGHIDWKGLAYEQWARILELHEPDLEILITTIHDFGYAGVATKIRNALAADASLPARSSRRLLGAHLPVTTHLHVDRAEHWAALEDATRSPPVSIYLLGGSRGLGHKFFLDCIRGATSALKAVMCLDVYPPVVERPSKIEHAVAGLRDILGEDDVGGALHRGLAEGNVILLHRPLSLADHASSWLPVYIGTVLPALTEIIAQAGAAMARSGPVPGTLVVVLPIEWKENGQQFRALLRRCATRPAAWRSWRRSTCARSPRWTSASSSIASPSAATQTTAPA